MDAQELRARFLASRTLSSHGRRVYDSHLTASMRWAEEAGLTFSELNSDDIIFLADEMRRRGLAASTISQRRKVLILFFDWLASEEVRHPKWPRLNAGPPPRAHQRPTLSLEELRRMWEASSNDAVTRALFSLLTFNALKCDEVSEADVVDIRQLDGHSVLEIRNPRRRSDLGFTVLAGESIPAISACVGGRLSGPLLRNLKGDRLTNDGQSSRIRTLARRADIKSTVTPSILSFTMRALAIDASFSFISVVRCMGQLHASSLAPWLRRASVPLEDHAALHTAALIVPRPRYALHLEKARRILVRHEQPPALAAVLAASTLEAFLRALGRARALNVEEERAKLSTYGERLRVAGILSNADIQLMKRIEEIRNWAAHGWFDRVGTGEAQWLISEVERLIEDVSARMTVDERRELDSSV